MRSKTLKGAVLAMVAGSTFGFFGGCLDRDRFLGSILVDGAIYAGMEFVLDNDTVFDLFEDGAAPTE
jgi:hypothetical protein